MLYYKIIILQKESIRLFSQLTLFCSISLTLEFILSMNSLVNLEAVFLLAVLSFVYNGADFSNFLGLDNTLDILTSAFIIF